MSVNSFLEMKQCNICGGDRTRVVHAFLPNLYNHRVFETASWDGRQSIPLTVVRCKTCGLVFTNPAFKKTSLDLVYPKDIIKVPDTDKLLANTRKFDELLEQAKPFMRGRTVVDIGTRYGVFPLVAKRAGFDALGVEFNEESVNIGKSIGAPIHRGTVDTLASIVTEQAMDHIDNLFMVDVLEHLTDPLGDLKIIASLQKTGARLFMKQMDLDSLGYRLFRGRWHYLQPAAHMYYFNEKTVTLLLDKAGYRLITVSRMPLLDNLRKLVKSAVRTRIQKRLGKPRKVWMVNQKEMYLNRRKRSTDDMFLVIAEKV
jgi:2-polyprenyl-3-methyl-5-hydroxy-6-metoxy-1,4-benzoquinol methylase